MSLQLARLIRDRVLAHLLGRLERTPAINEPFSHVYLEEVIPADLYHQLLHQFPADERYARAAERHHADGDGGYVRSMFALTPAKLAELSPKAEPLWRGIGAALTAPELKRAVYSCLSSDLMFRYGVSADQVPELAGYSRPTLYRETDGFEIPPHPDTRKKVVTMHLYLPSDHSQLELGTALYRHKYLALPVGPWRGRFLKIKQFPFQPNSGYAFVVNNTLTRKSWHGREKLPAGGGVRNTLLNTFYESVRDDFTGYLDAGMNSLRASA